MQLALVSQPSGGGDLRPIVGDSQSEATQNPSPVDLDRARAALTVVTTLPGRGQAKPVTQGGEQRRSGVDGAMSGLPVNAHGEVRVHMVVYPGSPNTNRSVVVDPQSDLFAHNHPYGKFFHPISEARARIFVAPRSRDGSRPYFYRVC